MSLVETYSKYFGAGNGEKQAGDQPADLTDAQIEEALSKMSEEQLQQLAKEVSEKNTEEKTADSEKEAEELFAGGKIFARGFIHEMNDGEQKTATEKFAEYLTKAQGE